MSLQCPQRIAQHGWMRSSLGVTCFIQQMFFQLEIEDVEIPMGTTELLVSPRTKITKLPDLPDGLLSLICVKNELTELPELPKSLIVLTVYDNKLKKIPSLPKSLNVLLIDNNPLEDDIGEFVEEYAESGDINRLRTQVNDFWARNNEDA